MQECFRNLFCCRSNPTHRGPSKASAVAKWRIKYAKFGKNGVDIALCLQFTSPRSIFGAEKNLKNFDVLSFAPRAPNERKERTCKWPAQTEIFQATHRHSPILFFTHTQKTKEKRRGMHATRDLGDCSNRSENILLPLVLYPCFFRPSFLRPQLNRDQGESGRCAEP